MAEWWDETDLTPAEARAMWEEAVPAEQYHAELTAASVRVSTGRTTTAPARLVDVHLTTPLRALAPSYR
jgi:hypothetical protein